MVIREIMKCYTWPMTLKQAADSGMALVLLFLLIGAFTHSRVFFLIAIPLLVINMAFPRFYKYFAWFWLGTTKLMGTVISRIILTLVYFLLVLPVGLIRRMIGKDSLLLTRFKKDNTSVLVTRNVTFSKKDIEKPF